MKKKKENRLESKLRNEIITLLNYRNQQYKNQIRELEDEQIRLRTLVAERYDTIDHFYNILKGVI